MKNNRNKILLIGILILSLLLVGCNDYILNEIYKSFGQEIFEGYRIIEVDGGDISGEREPNVAVDIGFGDRQYWAFTNEYGQLVKVIAKEIILQDDNREPVNSDGRYYDRMANVPGVGADTGYDRGHIIADSLGGVANAYNITPQNSVLNRHGNQAYMEKVIRDAGGCTDFEATITYPNTETQIPSKYKYTYTIKGNIIVDEFENVNPDDYNIEMGIVEANKNKDTEQASKSETNKYKASIESDKYHLADYTHSGQIAEHNLIWFDGIEDAEEQGYKPCGICFSR
ncbi:MAG: hypothetical protein GX231_07265 [Tissierellia bacterium]|nr:hypothetical protein [Tissierellia bacterium]